jgi:hypothetical protein
MKLRTALQVITLLLLLSPATILLASTIDPEVEACIRKNAPESSAIQDVRFLSKGFGYMSEDRILTAQVYWKLSAAGTSNLLAVFDQPDDISGSRLLFLEKEAEDEIYLYMPALFKVRRITSDRISSSMYGMDFSYEDFQWMYNMMSTAVPEQRPDANINGQPMYVFAVIPAEGEGSLYKEILAYFDKKSCVIQKVEFYEPGNKLRKVLVTDKDEIKTINGKLVPHKFMMRDEEENSETELTIVKVKVDAPVDDALFDPAQLKDQRGIE